MAYSFNPFTGNLDLTGSGGGGNIVGPPGGSTDNGVPRFDGTSGHALQDSLVTIDDSGNVVTPGDVSANNVNATGDIHADGDISADGDVSGTNLTATAAVSGATVSATGLVSGATITASGDLNGATVNTTANAEIGGDANVDGDVNAANFTTTGTVQAGDVNATNAAFTGLTSDTANITTLDTTDTTVAGTLEVATVHSTIATGSRVAVFDASSNLVSTGVTTTELGYVSGVTSAIQTQLNNKIETSEKGAANGVAPLDGGSKIPLAYLPSSIFIYKGVWDASTNTPTLSNGTGTSGWLYRVGTAGTVNFGAGPITFDVGDYVIYNSSNQWEKSDTTDAVASVNGQTGNVVLTTDDVSQGTTNKYYSQTLFDASLATKSTTDLAEGTNKYYTQTRFDAAFAAKTTDGLTEGTTNVYFTDERAQDAVGTILVDTASVNLTYDDATPSITADVIPGGVDHNQLLNFVANKHIDHSAVSIATAAGTSGLSGGGDITATRNIVVDIHGTTLKGSPTLSDELLIWDVAGSANKRVTRASILAGTATASAGDLPEGSFSITNNQAAAAPVTGFSFANAVVRSLEAIVSVSIAATTPLNEEFTIKAVQKGATWEPAISSVGDDSGVTFSINSSGQIQYQSSNYTGFSSGTVKFRAQTTSV